MGIGLVERCLTQSTLHFNVWLLCLSHDIINAAIMLDRQTSVTFHRCISAIIVQALLKYTDREDNSTERVESTLERSGQNDVVITSAKVQRSGTIYRGIDL